MDTATKDAEAGAEFLTRSRDRILAELRKVIVGQDAVIDLVLTALFTGGHCLITGVPGLAKTRLIKTLAAILDLRFKRIQFTPDLMPADITGTEILEETGGGHRALRFVEGPIFAQILLADEINRTPPKTQAALLEAMQEYHVTASGRTYPLQRPFFVLATQRALIDDNGDGRGTEAGQPGPDGLAAARLYLGAGLEEAEVVTDPRLAPLVARRQELRQAVDDLKAVKADMSPERYLGDLERVLIELARVSRQIRRASS